MFLISVQPFTVNKAGHLYQPLRHPKQKLCYSSSKT